MSQDGWAQDRSVVDVLRPIAESVRLHVDDLAAELVSLILATETGYAAGGGAVSAEDLHLSCRSNLDRLLQMLARTVPAGEDPLDAARRTGERRAGQLLPLGVLLHSYRLGGELVWRGLARQARTAPHRTTPDELVEIATEVWDVVDRGSMAVTEAYLAAEAELARRDGTRRAAGFHSLLEGRAGDVPPGRAATGAAEALALPAHGRYLVAVVPLSETSEPTCAPEVGLRKRGLPSSWHEYLGMQVGLVCLGYAGTEDQARQALSALLPGRAGISPTVDTLTDVAHAYQLALLAYRSVPNGAEEVAFLDDRLPEAMVAASPELAVRLARRMLDPLAALRDAEREVLLQTLRTWLDLGGSPGRVAAAQHCHRNTVLKRIHRIEALTGTRLDDARDISAWSLALFAARLADSRAS